MSPPKFEAEEKSLCTKESSKSENKNESKRPYNGIYLPNSKVEVKENSNNIEENRNLNIMKVLKLIGKDNYLAH